MSRKQASNYDLGLDIGIASVGWCLLGEQHIVDLGVRTFDKAEGPKGESLNSERRTARLTRHRLHRRAVRLLKLARLFKREGLIADSQLFKNQKPIAGSLWKLRVAALERRLDGEEWARVIYHICKHRGFWFPRKAEAESSEGGKVKKGLEHTRALLKDNRYRSVAEMMLQQFPEHQRNKQGDYSQSIARELLAEEMAALFQHQRALGNPHTNQLFEQAILDPATGLFWQQKPALSGEDIRDKIGKCTFETTEKRAAKHTWSAERFVWLTRLNHLRVNINGEIRGLNVAERAAVINLPYEKSKLTYQQLKKHLIKQGYWNDSAHFTGLGGTDPEKAALIELVSWHKLRVTCEKAGLKTEWYRLSQQPALLDSIGSTLSIYKTDDEVRTHLGELGLANNIVEALCTVSFSHFIRLSLKALQGILPAMEQGQRYDQACISAGYHHSVLPAKRDSLYLPALDDQAPNNPVVKRALNQARKVVNAIIRQYGSPNLIHIEMARDLSRSYEERGEITKSQKTFQAQKEKDRERFSECFHRLATGREFEKWQLYHEQDGKCAYSITPLDLERVVNDVGYAEIDHALPFSRSFDNSKNNKVLVLTSENRNKGNQTPYEYLQGAANSERWQTYQAFVISNKKYRQAKRDRLLRCHFGKEEAGEFKARNLQDTRYACRYFKNFIENHLQLASDAQRCVVVSGQLTHFLRTRWGLTKLRIGSDRHHALDAAVVAACSHAMVKRLSDYARRKELAQAKADLLDMETGEIINPAMLAQLEAHFPKPWQHFDLEVALRTGLDRRSGKVVIEPEDKALWRASLTELGYRDAELNTARPLFVSRAPKRRNGGVAHKETIYAIRATDEFPHRITQKIKLTELKRQDFSSLVEPHRNQALYEALSERLEAFGDDAKKAFAAPFYKPTRDSSQGPIVRSVTQEIRKLTGIPIRGGIAKNATMLRLDVFKKAGKYYLIPVYVHHRVAKMLPLLAIAPKKDEAEWIPIDDTFSFCFSLYPNDVVKITFKNKPAITGYYAGCDRDGGTIDLWVHDRNELMGKKGLIHGIGVKTALDMARFNVDVLGNIYPARAEVQRGLA